MPTLGSWQRFVIKGTGPSSEIWQTGFSTVCTTTPASQPDLQSLLNTIAPLIDTWWTSVKSGIYSSYAYTEVDAYQYVGSATAAQFQAQSIRTTSAGALATAGSPIDTACVCSLRTALPGRKGRGRMYIPCHVSVTPATGVFNSAQNATNGTATKTLFNAITSGSVAGPVVVSRAGGVYNVVTGIVTDNKPDVQRRRENRLPATSVQTLTLP